ncbi:hypothetical protein [Luteimonas changyuni]|uniref:hypothetical protein n=1 Tax=Luteimonas sp. MJ145 TaxID=3129234 RepID=UPI0031BAB118
MEDVMRICTIVVALSLLCLLPVAAAADSEAGELRFPAELLGVWDAYPLSCIDDGPSDSDMRILIEARTLGGYETNDALKSVQKIAEDPATWRMVTISDAAPTEIQGEADIYVLRGDVMTITNGERSYTYIRCK